jgi:hypothetical protein
MVRKGSRKFAQTETGLFFDIVLYFKFQDYAAFERSPKAKI